LFISGSWPFQRPQPFVPFLSCGFPKSLKQETDNTRFLFLLHVTSATTRSTQSTMLPDRIKSWPLQVVGCQFFPAPILPYN
jgi:hypothetical protein